MSPRLRCPRCERARCLCALLPATPWAHRTPVLIWQHPAEAGHVKGTARLLQLGLSACTLQREAPADLQGAALLYPGSGPALAAPPKRLIVLDGSWRQSRALLASAPALLTLPRLTLPASEGGAFAQLRRAPRVGQLSTLRAVALALQALEADDTRLTGLLGLEQALAQALALQGFAVRSA